MTIGDVNEQEYHFWLVMFMDRVYHLSDVNEKVYFSDVNKLGKWQLVMLITGIQFSIGDFNGYGVFSKVMLMKRAIVINWWC